MEHRKALTISLTVDKDTSMRNTLRRPKSQSSPEHGRLSDQVHCPNAADYKVGYPDTAHRKGSTLFEHNQKVMIRLGLASKNPCVILQDVLQTEPGRAFLGRNGFRPPLQNGTPAHNTSNGQKRGVPSPLRRSQRSDPREEEEEEEEEDEGGRRRRPVASQCHPRSLSAMWKTSHASPRVPELHNTPRRPQQTPVQRREGPGLNEPLIRTDGSYSEPRAQVSIRVPLYGGGSRLPVSPWLVRRRGLLALSPGTARGRSTEPSWASRQITLKRRWGTPVGRTNCAQQIKDPRQSILLSPGKWEPLQKRLFLSTGNRIALSQSERRAQAPGPVRVSLGEPASVEVCISPSVSPSRAGKSSPEPLGLSQDHSSGTSDPIVLSSDESESGESSPRRRPAALHLKVGVVEAAAQQKAPNKDTVTQEDATEPQVLEEEEEDDFPGDILSAFIVSSLSSQEYSCMTLPFYALHSGCYKGHANGNIMIQGRRLLIPLKGSSGKLRVLFAVDFKELRRYSLWERSELQMRGLHVYEDQQRPPMFLLLLVSYTQAVAVQTLLLKLSGQQRSHGLGQVSPFLLLSLKTHLEGVEVAVLRSALEIAALENLARLDTVDRPLDLLSELDDIETPDLSLDASLELIKRTGLDPQLLSLLGIKDDHESDSEAYPDPPVVVPPLIPEPVGLLDVHIKVCDPAAGLLSELSADPVVVDPEVPPAPAETTQTEEEKQSPMTEPAAPIPPAGPVYTLRHSRAGASYTVSLAKPDGTWTRFKHQGVARRLIQFPPPPSKGGITVTMEDLECLDSGQYLNDVIIDFYLKYLLHRAHPALAQRSHVFSSFFFKQLTRRDNASEDGAAGGPLSQSLRRHQRVKTWTRHVDIFQKDFLFVPVNQEAHWYLVVICFPGLEEPSFEQRTVGGWQKVSGVSGISDPPAQQEAPGPPEVNGPAPGEPAPLQTDKSDTQTETAREDSTDNTPPGPPKCSEATCQRDTVCKRPCILIMDSLKLSLHERIFKLMREYLQSEWEVRRGSARDFSAEQMKGSHCRVPLQDNCSDCGLYLLQYVESFLKDPVVHFDLPLRLERWFPRQQVRRKRDQIRDLVLYLYRQQQLKPASAT